MIKLVEVEGNVVEIPDDVLFLEYIPGDTEYIFHKKHPFCTWSPYQILEVSKLKDVTAEKLGKGE